MNKKQKAMFAHINGVQGRSPCKKKHCHPEGANTCRWQVAIPTSRRTPPFSFGKPSEMPADRLAPGRCVALQRTYSLPKANSGSSCRPNLQGRRGACTERFDVHNRKIIVKRSCLHIQKA